MTLADVLMAGFEREYAPPPPPRDYKADFADDYRYLSRREQERRAMEEAHA